MTEIINIFQGVLTALITPFKHNKIDNFALAKIIQHQISCGTQGLVIAGTTGEGMLLSKVEYQDLIQESIKLADGKIKIIAGNSLCLIDEVIESTERIKQLGADGLMLSIPPYLKPSQDGIGCYFQTIAKSTDLPIMLYSNPSRTIVDFSYETILELAQEPNIIALKCSSANLERAAKLSAYFKGSNFNILAGDDTLALPYYSVGAKGWVSVVSNIFPARMQKIHQLIRENQYPKAREIQFDLLPLYEALGAESNPVSVKWAKHHLSFCSDEIRLPLTTPSIKTQEKLIQALAREDIKS